MARYDFDLFTIGAGSGGVRASRMSARYGARVAIAEERDLGGTCVNLGCIPKKLLVYASAFRRDVEDAVGFGWTPPPPSHDWRALIRNKDVEIARLNGVYARLLDDAGVQRIDGRARLVDAHTVAVGRETFSAEHILVATGSWPTLPAIPGIEHAISSNEAFHLDAMPERPIVVGGGYIAAEFAGILHGLGARVTQLYRGPLFLRGFDDDVRTHLAAEFRQQGIDLRFDSDIARIEKASDGVLRATLADGSRLEADAILFATGRHPLTRGSRARGAEGGDAAERRDLRRRVLALVAAERVRDRRRHGSHQPDAGRDPRGDVPRRDAVRRKARPARGTRTSRRRCSASPRSARSGAPRRWRARATARSTCTARRSASSSTRSRGGRSAR